MLLLLTLSIAHSVALCQLKRELKRFSRVLPTAILYESGISVLQNPEIFQCHLLYPMGTSGCLLTESFAFARFYVLLLFLRLSMLRSYPWPCSCSDCSTVDASEQVSAFELWMIRKLTATASPKGSAYNQACQHARKEPLFQCIHMVLC